MSQVVPGVDGRVEPEQADHEVDDLTTGGSTELTEAADGSGTETPKSPPMDAAKAPVGAGPAPLVATVLAVVLVLVGLILIRDAVIEWGWVSGTSWTRNVLGRAGTVTPRWWLVPICLVLLVLGIWLLLAALKPRPRRGLRLEGSTGVYIRHHDLKKLLEATAGDTDGVEKARATVSSARKVSLRLETTAEGEQASTVADAVRSATEPIIGALAKQPRLAIKTSKS